MSPTVTTIILFFITTFFSVHPSQNLQIHQPKPSKLSFHQMTNPAAPTRSAAHCIAPALEFRPSAAPRHAAARQRGSAASAARKSRQWASGAACRPPAGSKGRHVTPPCGRSIACNAAGPKGRVGARPAIDRRAFPPPASLRPFSAGGFRRSRAGAASRRALDAR